MRMAFFDGCFSDEKKQHDWIRARQHVFGWTLKKLSEGKFTAALRDRIEAWEVCFKKICRTGAAW